MKEFLDSVWGQVHHKLESYYMLSIIRNTSEVQRHCLYTFIRKKMTKTIVLQDRLNITDTVMENS